MHDTVTGSRASTMRGLAAIPELVRRSGVETVFAMLGGTNAAWIAQGVESGAFRLVRTRHEDTAVNAAGGFARSTGGVGICSVTRGPGFGNAVNALIAATISHIPVVLVVAESPATRARTEQNIDQAGITAAIGAGFHHAADADALEPAFWSAMRAARWDGRAQVLSLGDGLLDASVALSDGGPPDDEPRPGPADENVAAAVDALARSSRPLILAGQGAVLAGCRDELEALADLVGARVATSLRATSFFAGHPRNLGLCGGWAAPAAREELARSDVVLVVGASFNTFTADGGALFPHAEVIHCDVAPKKGWQATAAELTLQGDASVVTRALVEEWERRGLGRRPVDGVTADFDALRRSVLDVDLGHDPARGLDPRHVCARLDAILPPDRIVVTDLGRYLAILPSLVAARDGYSWLSGRGHGSVGLGLGTAVGAAAAWPGRPVVLFCGDGGFMMSLHDVDAARVNGLDLTVVVLNDEQLGQDVHAVTRYGLPPDILRQQIPDVPTLAESVDATGIVLRSAEDLARLELPGSGLTIVDARLDRQVNSRGVFG